MLATIKGKVTIGVPPFARWDAHFFPGITATNNEKNGNLVSGDGFYREYNGFNQLWKVYNGTSASGVLLEEYTYDPLEERVLIKNTSLSNGTWKETVYYIFDEYIEVVNSSGTYGFTYVKHEGQLVAELKPDGSKIFYHPDHLGSTTLITNSSGAAIENTSFTPYGEVYEGGNVSRFDYEGKETDDITRQKDFHFRMQGIAGTPPFSQPDTLIQNVYDPQSLNRYAFERNNPLKYIDPNGHFLQGCMISPTCVSIVYTLTNLLAWYVSDPSRLVRSIGSLYLRLKESGSLENPNKPLSIEDYRIYEGTFVPPEARGPNWVDPNQIKIPDLDVGKLLNKKPIEEDECEDLFCPTSEDLKIKPPPKIGDNQQIQNFPPKKEPKNSNSPGTGGKGGVNQG
ncbi:hypothetical protein HYU14_04105 [Candidatus Woesearchaeota archaeon]|nr:hypothetical protein [Candidatus Woesearchaeota archaeon]